MHSFRWIVFLGLLPVPAIAQEPGPPLMVGQTVEDAVVVPLAQFVDHGWKSVPQDTTGLPGVPFPYYWYQPTATGKSLGFNPIATVKVLQGIPEEDSYWAGGQFIQPVDDSIGDKRFPFRGQLLVDSLVPSGVFVFDSSGPTRTRLLSLLQRVFPDSFAVPDVTGRSKELVRGTAPVSRLMVQRVSPVKRGSASLILVEAERCFTAKPDDCGDSQLLELWLLDQGSRYQVLTQRGPIRSDSDFKSGSGLSARAWLELEGRRFLLVECKSYTDISTVVYELLPTGVRQVYPSEVQC